MLHLAIATIDPLRDKNVEFVGGLFFGAQRFYDWLVQQPQCQGKPILYPEPEELRWAKQPLNHGELQRIRDTYGSEALHRAVVSDRHLGFGYVNGGLVAETSLTKLIRKLGPDAIWQYMVELVCCIEKTFDETKPDVVFQYATANAVAVMTQVIAKSRDIHVFGFSHTRMGQEIFLSHPDGPTQGDLSVPGDTDTIDPKALEQARQQIREFRDHPTQPEYISFVTKALKQQRSWKGIVKGLAKTTSGLLSKKHETPHSSRFYNGLRDAHRPLRHRRQHKIIHRLARPIADFMDRPYAFYTLHVDPEATTMVLAPDFTDQLNVIQEISQSLPFGMPLLVKEHMPMVGSRPAGFYTRISEMPGVILVPAEAAPYELIRNAALVIALAGTTAFEAVMFQRPVLLMGYPYFRALQEGITKLQDHHTMKEAIDSAIQQKPASDDCLAQFIAWTRMRSFSIPSDIMWSTKAQKESDSLRTTSELLATNILNWIQQQ